MQHLAHTGGCHVRVSNGIGVPDEAFDGGDPSMKMRLYTALLLTSLSAASLFAQTPAPSTTSPLPGGAGVGDLLVAPTRVVLEGNKRTAELTLVNIGKAPALYRISLIHMRMTEAGELKEFEEAKPEDMVADSIVRYSPRQVMLEPNVSQTVRLQLRKPANLPAGEYRSHILFRAVPPAEEPASAKTDTAPPEGLTIRLRPIFGLSIPLIVRHGTTKATSTIEQVKLIPPAAEGAPWKLAMRLTRSGDQSVYGSVQVATASPGKEQIVGMLNGVAVYTPLGHRQIEIPLRSEENIDFNAARLRISYREAEELGGGLIAETQWNAGN